MEIEHLNGIVQHRQFLAKYTLDLLETFIYKCEYWQR